MFKERISFSLIAISLALNACTIASPPASTCGPEPSKVQIDAAVKAYTDNVSWKDPDSVHIRNVQLRDCRTIPHGLLVKEAIPTGWTIVFEVNAKNSYGGYTGFEARSVILTSDGKIHYDP